MKQHLRELIFLLVFISLTKASLFSQSYTWISGSTSTNQVGAYGSLGVPATGNSPGAREGAVCWKDAAGDFWLFGGNGFDYIGNAGYLNDLWRYSPSTGQWTWIKGDNIGTQTGAYGTLGIPANGNKPGGRSLAVSWLDANGNVYLFGGYGYDAAGTLGYLNDLWKFSPANNLWTWIKGSNLCYQPATYGTIGIATSSNNPGARYGTSGWTDGSGNFWLFGGFGNTTSSLTVGYLNDMWKYSVTTNQWTWVKGSNSANPNGIYGTQNVAATNNNPGGRNTASVWMNAAGDFLLFGGNGYDATGTSTTYLNDLWKYSPSTGHWVWLRGSSNGNQAGLYGTLGVTSSTNDPGSRCSSICWADAVGNFWMGFGLGYGSSAASSGKLNDLWKYNAISGEWMCVKGNGSLDLPGSYGSQGVAAGANTPGARLSASNWIDANGNLWLFGGYGQPATPTSTAAAGELNDLWKFNNCFISPLSVTISSSAFTVCAGESVTITAGGGSNISWSNGANTLSIVVHPTITTTYMASAVNNNNCVFSSSFTQSINPCTSITNYAVNSGISLYPNPYKECLNIEGAANGNLMIQNLTGQVVFEQTLANKEINKVYPALLPGVYVYSVFSSSFKTTGKLVVE